MREVAMVKISSLAIRCSLHCKRTGNITNILLITKEVYGQEGQNTRRGNYFLFDATEFVVSRKRYGCHRKVYMRGG